MADTDGYSAIYLHTNPAIEEAKPFWHAMAKEIYDARRDHQYIPAIHFGFPDSALNAPDRDRHDPGVAQREPREVHTGQDRVRRTRNNR